jgi:beta-1,4-mannosyl-glycoprotein beta-1,4-N-acetylglucosaminyltransferase
MIWDTFMFYNELDILEIRLNILDPYVDKFVLVEATRRHSGVPKPLYYAENCERFSKFADKIVHVVVDDLPIDKNFWIAENYQRNCITRGIKDARSHDCILISDVDEIPRPTKFTEMKKKGISIFSHDYYVYYLNSRSPDEPYWNMGTRSIHKLEITTPQEVRSYGSHRQPVGNKHTIFYGGWHFSYCGGIEAVRDKLKGSPDMQIGKDRPIHEVVFNAERNMENGIDPLERRGKFVWRPVPIDETFPEYIRVNQNKYSHLIKPIGVNHD